MAAIIAVAVTTGVAVGVSIGVQLLTTGRINFVQVIFDGLMGALAGLLMLTGLGPLGMALWNGTLGFVSSVASQGMNGGEIDWLGVFIQTIVGFGTGLTGGATYSKFFHDALGKSAEYAKAAASYDNVLNKIAAGQYKNLAGAAGARHWTTRRLNAVMDTISDATIKKSIKISLPISLAGNLGIFGYNVFK